MSEWYKKNIKDIYEELETNDFGLSEEEVNKRQEKYGKNSLPKFKKKSTLLIFFSQFVNSIIYIMIFACLFSFAIGDVTEGIAIICIIFIDAVVGTIQEVRASKNSASLQELIKHTVKVIRNNKKIEIDSEELVPGDVVMLVSGDKVSADIRIISCNNLTVNESILTGESNAVVKDFDANSDTENEISRSNILYSGTSVLTGRALGVVVGIGLNTEIGSIAETVVKEKSEQSPLTVRMNKFSKQVVILIIIIAIILTGVMISKDLEITEVILSVIALSVSAMPEGLPLAVTLVLSIASNRMSKKNVIIKKLNAAESLGSATLIATDKTGTLTVNEQTAKKIITPNGNTYVVTGSGYNAEGQILNLNNEVINICKLGIINNESRLYKENRKWSYFGDSIDVAFLALGEKAKLNSGDYKIIDRIPYESEKMYSAVFYKEGKKSYCTVKGSVEVILNFCDKMYDGKKNVKLDRKKIIKQNDELAQDGYRVIAVCYKETDSRELSNLIFCGLVAFIDPVRDDVKESIAECKSAGIKVVMITGDHALTAYSIAKEIDIATSFEEVTTGEELSKYLKKGKKAFEKFIKNKTVFTRTSPNQKLKIVEAFKKTGHYVAVTGDGVNDAPSIKVANIGVSMGSGTDVTKETSTLIITDDSFSSVVSGIKEGRIAYSNIRKVTYMLLSCGLGEVLFFTLSVAFGMPIPLVTIQLLWLNLVTDGLQDMALAFESEEIGIMKEKPRKPGESLLDKKLMASIILSGLSIGIIVFTFWTYLIKDLNMDTTLARTYIVILMVFIQNFHVLNCRSEKNSIFKMPLFSNPYVILSITVSLLLQLIMMSVPILSKFLQLETIDFKHLLIPILFSFSIVVVMEIFKIFRRMKEKRETILK